MVTNTTTSIAHCAILSQIAKRTPLPLSKRSPKILFRYIREGTKKRDNSFMETNDEEPAHILTNFFTRENTRPEEGLRSHAEIVNILCNDVTKIFKSRKYTNPRAKWHPPNPLNGIAGKMCYALANIFQISLEKPYEYQDNGWQHLVAYLQGWPTHWSKNVLKRNASHF